MAQKEERGAKGREEEGMREKQTEGLCEGDQLNRERVDTPWWTHIGVMVSGYIKGFYESENKPRQHVVCLVFLCRG